MIDTLKKLFSSEPKQNYSALLKNGAVIVDVRTKGEYASGHIKGSINIPLDALRTNLYKLDKKRPVITCCASGMRSSSARQILKSCGYEEVYNGGGWAGLAASLEN